MGERALWLAAAGLALGWAAFASEVAPRAAGAYESMGVELPLLTHLSLGYAPILACMTLALIPLGALAERVGQHHGRLTGVMASYGGALLCAWSVVWPTYGLCQSLGS